MQAQARHLRIGEAVRQAQARRQAVVALESTIITHGMPYPDNRDTALRAEQAIRDAGATPATIAVLEGTLACGLDREQLERLAQAGDAATKCSRRDLPFALHSGATAGTTVAATMLVAALAGIRVFATGGIGGVHRGAEHTFDVSADLQELARTPVAVVCAGPKSILDIGLTLEYLETHGVPVVGYRTRKLPAFFARESGFEVDYRLDTVEAIAAALRTQWSLGLDGGAVIANPLPAGHALERERMEQVITRATGEAAQAGVTSKALTPFLLRRVAELTGGESLRANIEIMLGNADLAARIAVALVALESADG